MTTGRAADPRAVLFDRDGTLIVDVPYNGDPDRVEVMPGAAAALSLLRAKGILTGVVTNQSGIGRGIVSADDVARVNERVDELLGPFDTWRVCPHREEDDCCCRKPRPGMLLQAVSDLGVAPGEVTYVGDIGTDMQAAAAAGIRGVMIPTAITRLGEILDAPVLAPDLLTAVTMVLDGFPERDASDDDASNHEFTPSGEGPG